jgi:hypothetical protein
MRFCVVSLAILNNCDANSIVIQSLINDQSLRSLTHNVCVFLVSFNIHYSKTSQTKMMMNEKVTFSFFNNNVFMQPEESSRQEKERERERKEISN